MPIFEYACASCGKEFEVLVRGSSPAPRCPSCHGEELNKKLSAFAAVTGSAATASELPSPCNTCGNPGGPGACRFD